ncbi:hypothetical protein J2128_001948 [Methanomicrobium sp. W14]|uniref:hypothetical protein n=1 Tax=Methanomicrobium sp. W14 TaxID=2817839 RepID=UPI001AE58CF7|nr:hypothetical protein [Methanomicrobium sp. W14]MBP2133982.1 hypothetical protein [Methanomicrobium sp. W14]
MKRHDIIGIKQSVRLEWMQKTSDLLLEGKNEKEIRNELKEYLSERMGRGVFEKRSETACNFSVSMLMRIWVVPDKDLLPFRDAGLKFLKNSSEDEQVAIHFCMLSAAYPFWYNVSKQIGMLLRLQENVTIQQIIQRTKEYYGDRQTVDRNTQFVIRSLYYWNLLEETDLRGCYKKGINIEILSETLNSWIIEAQLHSISDGKAVLSSLQNDMALFSFNTKKLNSTVISKNNKWIEVFQSGMSDEIMMIK